MMAKEYGERMRQQIIDLLKENEGEKFSIADIDIYFNLGYANTMYFLKQIRDQNIPNLKHEHGHRRVSLYWWDEK